MRYDDKINISDSSSWNPGVRVGTGAKAFREGRAGIFSKPCGINSGAFVGDSIYRGTV